MTWSTTIAASAVLIAFVRASSVPTQTVSMRALQASPPLAPSATVMESASAESTTLPSRPFDGAMRGRQAPPLDGPREVPPAVEVGEGPPRSPRATPLDEGERAGDSGLGAQDVIEPVAAPEDSRTLSVAVGLGRSVIASDEARMEVSVLERGVAASAGPHATVTHVPAGSSSDRSLCRRGGYDLLLWVEGADAETTRPVIDTWDCRLERPLGTWPIGRAADPALLAEVWSHHDALIAAGARERPQPAIGRKGRGALIGVGVALVVGLAIGLVVASSLREESVVLRVGP